MEYKDAFEILAKVKEGISEYEKDTHLTYNVTAGQLYVALTHVLGKAALQQKNSADKCTCTDRMVIFHKGHICDQCKRAV